MQSVVLNHHKEPLVAIGAWIENTAEAFAVGRALGEDRTMVMVRREA